MNFGEAIRKLRKAKGEPLRKVAAYLDMDQAILSKIERGERKATREQVISLASYYQAGKDELLVAWLSDKIVYELGDEEMSIESLHAAEEKVAYKLFRKTDKSEMIKKIRHVVKEFSPVENAWLFGSFIRQDDSPGSDIDILIDVPEERQFTLFDMSEIQHKLQHLLHRKVDVVMLTALSPKVKQRIQNELKLIYEAGQTDQPRKN